MSSINTSKSSCKRPCDKYHSPETGTIPLNESNLSIRPDGINVNGNSYVNTPSPSSIASSNSYKNRPKNDLFGKRRHRYDKLFHYTHSLNRHYVVTMTNILFQMQKELYKLKRRTNHVEQMLANQKQIGLPIVRIPRLTKDEISTIYIKDDENQQTMVSEISEEKENKNESSPITNEDLKPSNETESSITLETKSPTDQVQAQQSTLFKYCSACNHEFSHRSAYLRHVRRKHDGIFSTPSNHHNSLEVDNSNTETPISTIDQSENESFQMLVNQWDIGEGRLRPRRTSKLNNEPISRVKCDLCGKFFRAAYIKKHQRRTHRILKSGISIKANDSSDEIMSITAKPMDDVQTTADESPKTNTDPPSAITIAEIDVDDMPIQFRKESNKPIVIVVTCLERYQLNIIEEFLKKFPSRVSQASIVDSRTTHIITNDDQHFSRSALSMKLIEGIAHHCFCVSFRWIIDCLKYDRIIDENPYEIEGYDTDYQLCGGPKRSRLAEKRHSLFENVCFMIKCTENNDNRVSNDRLQDLITTCGGHIIACVTQSLLDQFDIVVLCDRLYVSERRHNYDQCRLLGINFVSSEWVLQSIREYRQKPFTSFEETPL